MADAAAARTTPDARPLARRELLAGVVLVGLANGIAPRILGSVAELGWQTALMATFDISAIVWIGCAMLLSLLWHAPDEPVKRADGAIAALCLAAFLLPLGQASWAALTLLALYLALTTRAGTPLRRAGLVLFMLCLPMLWARLLLSAFSAVLLNTDAALVAALAGTTAVENAVPFADGSGHLWIAPACSSVLNLSLTLLCAVLFCVGSGLAWSWRMTAWTALACLAVAAINIARLTALVLIPAAYDQIHGPEGATAVGLVMLAAMVAILAFGTRHERARLG